MNLMFDDGGRADAGYKATEVGDCVCRAIAIATEILHKMRIA